MIKLRSFLLFSVAISLLTSCSQEDPWTSQNRGEGYINIKLTSSGEVSSSLPNVRSISSEVITPPIDSFGIRLSQKDGSFTKSWSSLSEFEKEHEFAVGTYHLEAFYGSEDSQGVILDGDVGHEYSYYYGIEENIEVKQGEVTTVQLRASLANSVVVVEYTDAFKNYFKSWSTVLQTEGKSSLTLGDLEGMAYVVSGNVDVIIRAMLQNGKTVSINPAVFEALPQYMYKIRYNVNNGEIGKADSLEITFNDDPEETHKVVVDLSEELLNSDAPVVRLDVEDANSDNAYFPGSVLEVLEGSPFEGEVKYTITAGGGIAEAKLSISSNNTSYNPPFLENGVIDLCKATEYQKNALESAGIKTLGLFNNPDKMAVVDLSEFCKSLPLGSSTISLVVKDRALRVNEPVEVKFSTEPLEMKIEPKDAFFGDGWGEVIISYNGPDPTVPGNNPFSFKVQGDYNYSDAEIISVNGLPYTRAFDSKEYVYRIKLPAASREEYPVQVFLNNIRKDNLNTKIPLVYPQYKVEYDPLATVIRLRVTEYTDKDGKQVNILDNPEKIELFTNIVKVFVDNVEISDDRIARDSSTGIILVKGLHDSSSYNMKTRISNVESEFNGESTVSTETLETLPNEGFAEIEKKNIDNIKVGGVFEVTWGSSFYEQKRDYQTQCNLEWDEPVHSEKGWATINEKTCYENAVSHNTWYKEPSTYINEGICTIRTVGYSHTEDVSSLEKNTSKANMLGNGGTTYCTSSPTENQFSRGIGELFLGTYSFTNGLENRKDGINFSTRPTGLSFKYSYMKYGEDYGYAKIKIKDIKGNVIAQSEDVKLEATLDSWNVDESQLPDPEKEINLTIDLKSYPFKSQAASIEVIFKSSSVDNPTLFIPTGSQLDQNIGSVSTSGGTPKIDDNAHKAYAVGSVLKVSDIKLVY